MRLLRRIVLGLVLVLIAAAIWAGIYAQKRGFSRTWRELVEAEFASRGYYVDIGRLTLGPFQGLVAEDVRFFNDPQRRRELAFVDNVLLDLDLTDVLNRDLAINTLDVKDAKVTLPVTPGRRDSELLVVDRFSARIVMTENQIEVVRAQAAVAGVQLSMKGSLYRPPRHAAKPAAVATEEELAEQRTRLLEIRRSLARVQQVVREIEQFSFSPDHPPRLELTFSGDLADLPQVRVEARLSAEQFRRGTYGIESLQAGFSYAGATGIALLRDLHLRDRVGALRVEAEWSPTEETVDFDLESTSDLPSMLAALHPSPKLGEVVFFSPPHVEAEGTVYLGGMKRFLTPPEGESRWQYLPVRAMGSVTSERFGSRGAVFDGMEAQFAIDGRRYYLRNLRLDHKSGVMFAHFMFDPSLTAERLRFQTEIKLDPKLLGPFLTTEEARHFIANWQFGPESTVYLAALGQGPSADPGTWKMTGAADLRRFRLNNVAFDHLESNYEAEAGVHRFLDLTVRRPEGSLTAESLSHQSATRLWEATGLRSTLDLPSLVKAVAPQWQEPTRRYQFAQPPELTLAGRIDPAGQGGGHAFELGFSSSQGATFDFLGRPLPLFSPGGRLKVQGDRWVLEEMKAGVFGGQLTARIEADSLAAGAGYRAEIAATTVDFDQLLHLYGNTVRNGGGTWTGSVKVAGKLNDPRSVTGGGQVSLQNGDLLAIPLLAPALEPLVKAAGIVTEPADDLADRSGQGASATVRLAGGTVTAEDLQIATERFDLTGRLSLDRNARTFSCELDPGILPGLTLRGDGPTDAPRWRLLPAGSR